MNKYQECLMQESRSYCGLAICGETLDDKIFVDSKLVLKQDEDITITDYMLYIANVGIEAIFAVKGTTEKPLKMEYDPIGSSPKSGDQNRFYMPISFDNRIDSIRIVFKNNLADDLIVPIEYEAADKDAYYAKQKEKQKEKLLAAASINCSTGADLVNIYFQPCNKNYLRTEIMLYREDKMLAKYKVEEECFFKSIGGLAYGKYSFILKQFDKENKLILETTQIPFNIAGTVIPHRPTNRIS